MEVEPEQNEAESTPPGYRTLTEEELKRLKLALSKLHRRELPQVEQDKLMQVMTAARDKLSKTVETFEIAAVWKDEMLTLKKLRDESSRTKEQLLKDRQTLWEMRQWESAGGGRSMKTKWFLLGVMSVFIPIFLLMIYGMVRGAKHW